MPDVAVELKDVVKRFPGPSGEEVYAVRQVSLQIGDGEFFSLLGPSGCGKTTSLRMIAGFEMPTEGDVLIHGRSMGGTPAYQRPVNTVFQSYALFPHMTVGENVGFGLEMKGVPRSEIGPRVSQALEMVRLPGFEKRQPKQLSGGQQQRIALARALINRPEVLLLDEPLGALDLKLRKDMQLELKRLQREVGITFVYVTHDQEEALTMSDRIAVMNAGTVLQIGPASEIYEEPNSRFVADFIGETNFIEGTVTSINGGSAQFEGNGLTIVADAAPGLVAGTRATLAVRPERIQLGPNKPEGVPNVFPGRVIESVYVGTDTRYLIELAPTVSVRVRQQNIIPTGFPVMEGPAGIDLWVSWSADSARVLVD
jgi:spermidine/putrescine transport system ATP-binding protein